MTGSQMTQIIVASREENKLSDYNTRDLGKGRVAGLKKRKREPSLAFAGFFFFYIFHCKTAVLSYLGPYTLGRKAVNDLLSKRVQ